VRPRLIPLVRIRIVFVFGETDVFQVFGTHQVCAALVEISEEDLRLEIKLH